MSSPISISIETSLASFNATLERYMLLVSKLPDEVLEKKGRDVGIKLFQGFRAHRWKGSRGTRGLAWRELAARAKDGEGIKVRAGIQPSGDAPDSYLSLRKLRGAAGKMRRLLVPQKTSLWQRKVFAELSLRQKGVGVLAASFLWFRKRTSQDRGTYYVKNKTGKPLGYVEKGDGFLSIVGLTDGLARVDARYGIVSGALAGAEADMMIYIQRKEEALRAATLGVAA